MKKFLSLLLVSCIIAVLFTHIIAQAQEAAVYDSQQSVQSESADIWEIADVTNSEDYCRLVFKITDKNGNELSNANIVLEDGLNTYKPVSDPWAVEEELAVEVPIGVYQLSVSAAGYGKIEATITVEGDAVLVYELGEADYYADYAEVVQNLLDIFGYPEIREDNYRAYLVGLSAVRLMDLNNDGIEELIVHFIPNFFEMSSMVYDGREINCQQAEVWTYEDNAAKRLFSGNAYAGGSSNYISLWNKNGEWLFASGENGYTLIDLSLYGIRDGELTVVKTFAASNGVFKVDGLEVDSASFNDELDNFSTNKISINTYIFPVSDFTHKEADQVQDETFRVIAQLGVGDFTEEQDLAEKNYFQKVTSSGDYEYWLSGSDTPGEFDLEETVTVELPFGTISLPKSWYDNRNEEYGESVFAMNDDNIAIIYSSNRLSTDLTLEEFYDKNFIELSDYLPEDRALILAMYCRFIENSGHYILESNLVIKADKETANSLYGIDEFAGYMRYLLVVNEQTRQVYSLSFGYNAVPDLRYNNEYNMIRDSIQLNW